MSEAVFSGPAQDPSRHWLADACLLLLAFIWGFSFVIVKQTLAYTPVFSFNALRFSVASLSLLPFSWKGRDEWKGAFGRGLLLAVLLYAGFAFQTSGLRFTSPSKSAFITASSVLWVPLFLLLFWKKRSSTSSLIGVALGVVGLYVLSAPGDGGPFNAGDGLTGLCAVAWAFHIIYAGRFSPLHSTRVLAWLQISLAAVLFWITSLAVGGPGPIPVAAVGPLLYTGVLCTSVCLALQLWAQRHTSPTRAGLLLATEPLFASVTSYLWIGERLTGKQIAGALLILGGVVWAEAGHWREARRKHGPAQAVC